MREEHDTVVIGAGQAGLAMSAVVQQHGREHVVLERGQVGGRWRTERWDSLRLRFPNWSLELPGWAYSGEDPDGFAPWHEIPAPDRGLHGERAGPGARAHRGHPAGRGGRQIRRLDSKRHDPRPACGACDRTVPAAADPALLSGRCAVGAADRSDTLPASGGSAGRRGARGRERRVRLPDR
jgi:hypothetical protein